MTKAVLLDQRAEAELSAAETWYEEQAGLGADFVAAVREAGRRIRENPRAFPLASGVSPALEVRGCAVTRFPFVLFFTEMSNEIRVLAVAHQRRRPLYWRKRAVRSRRKRS
jgi:toxin ParE1/3/4